MDNTFSLQPEEVSASTGLQENTVTESGDIRTAEEPDTPLHMDADGYEELAEYQELMEIIGNRDAVAETEQGSKEDVEIERPYKLRPLKDSDLFPMLKILRKVGIGEFKSVFSHFVEDRKGNEKSEKEIGMAAVVEAVEILVSNIPNAETEIYNLWSELSGIKAEIIREMEFGTLPMMIMDTFMNARGTSFFKVLSKFF